MRRLAIPAALALFEIRPSLLIVAMIAWRALIHTTALRGALASVTDVAASSTGMSGTSSEGEGMRGAMAAILPFGTLWGSRMVPALPHRLSASCWSASDLSAASRGRCW